jgi:serine/threonine-protein kinase
LPRAQPSAAAPIHAVLPLASAESLFMPRPPLAISPDGRTVVFAGYDKQGAQMLFRRRLADDHAEPIPGTERGSRPFFSPDGQWIAFIVRNELRKVSLLGGTSLQLASVPPISLAGTWGTDGRLMMTMGINTGLYTVPEGGGSLKVLIRLNDALGEHALLYPQLLPGGQAILCTQRLGRDFADVERSNLVVIDLASGKRKPILEGVSFARYGGGRLVFMRGPSIFSVPFDPSRLATVGEPVVLRENVAIDPIEGIAYFAISAGGDLAFVDGPALRLPTTSVVRLDRQGRETVLALPAAAYFNPRLSPDGKRLALVLLSGLRTTISVYDRERHVVSTLTPEVGRFFCPTWSPDGQFLAFSRMTSARPSIGIKKADGSDEIRGLTAPSENAQFVNSWSPDARTIAYTVSYGTDEGPNRRALSEDVWFLPADGSPTPPRAPWFESPYREAAPAFSPDGKWVAYVSDDSGNREIYVRPYPGPGAPIKVSTEPGMEPVWSRDGRELLYRGGERGERFLSIDVQTAPTFSISTPRLLFTAELNLGGQWGARGNREEGFRDFDVSHDGAEFFGTRFVKEDEPPRQLVVVTNWAAAAK